MITTLLYDGTFEGLLTTVFDIYERKLGLVNLEHEERYTATMFQEVIKIVTDETRSNRVLKGLKTKISSMGVQRLYVAHLAGLEGEENNLLGYLRYAFDSKSNIEDDYGNKYVLRVSEIVRMMRREKHRMEVVIHGRSKFYHSQ